MAPELFNIGTEGISGLSTYESDVFALGMVTFEVKGVYIESLRMVLRLPLVPPSRCSRDKCRSPTISSP